MLFYFTLKISNRWRCSGHIFVQSAPLVAAKAIFNVGNKNVIYSHGQYW